MDVMNPAQYSVTPLLYPHVLLNPSDLPSMQFLNQWGNIVLCHKAEGRSYDKTHYLCRVRGHVLRDDLSLQSTANGYNGILVLQPSENPQLAKFFNDGVETLLRLQKGLAIPEERLIEVIQNVGGQLRFTLLATRMMHGLPFQVKDNQGEMIQLNSDELTFKGLEVDVVFSFYYLGIAVGGEEPKVQTVARLLEIQKLL
ncbi:hypothetical protein BDN72DRAFT_903340 [Pluteus cervinus]|uniref:Uncharacterized protein n=1 Tax=Pluteus cervinus TaxID=181527 RepID=A0ACD3A9M9_9AGAR|nr:hypothetical protein BDN72DRAFT_903340 [Pluteus cervinus]